VPWTEGVEPVDNMPDDFTPLWPAAAEMAFLARYEQLQGAA